MKNLKSKLKFLIFALSAVFSLNLSAQSQIVEDGVAQINGEVLRVFIDGDIGIDWGRGICSSDTGTGFADYCGDGNSSHCPLSSSD